MESGGLGTGKFGSTMQLSLRFKDGMRPTFCPLPLIWETKRFGSGRTPAVGIIPQRTIRPRTRVASIFQHWLAVLTMHLAKAGTAAEKIR